MRFILMLLICYLVGAIPCGYLVGKKNNIDLRSRGSGNVGATNAFRLLGPQLGLTVLLLDLAKGFLPVLIVNLYFGPGWAVAAGLAAIVGHSWSIFLGFRGGKGVATGAGVLIALMPWVVLIAFIIWLLVILLSGYVSLGSIIGAIAVAILALFFKVPGIYFLFVIPAVVLVIVRHLPNIRRLQMGTESRVRFW